MSEDRNHALLTQPNAKNVIPVLHTHPIQFYSSLNPIPNSRYHLCCLLKCSFKFSWKKQVLLPHQELKGTYHKTLSYPNPGWTLKVEHTQEKIEMWMEVDTMLVGDVQKEKKNEKKRKRRVSHEIWVQCMFESNICTTDCSKDRWN